MSLLGRLAVLTGTIIAIGIALSIGIALLGAIMIVGGVAIMFIAGRQFLLQKGILNPTPGVAPDMDVEQVTVIEGDYVHVDKKETKSE